MRWALFGTAGRSVYNETGLAMTGKASGRAVLLGGGNGNDEYAKLNTDEMA